ncbi:unnamed protein product [Prunus armeniaca]
MGLSLPLISFSSSKLNQYTKNKASKKKIQTISATRGKSMSASFSSGDSAGVITCSKTKAISTTQHVTSISTQAKAKNVNRMRELVINLASLGAKKHTS